MARDDPRRLLRTMLSPNRLYEIPVRIHQIEVNAMIDQVILSLLHILRRTEIHSILLTDIFNLFPRTGQADDGRVELGEVFREDAWCVPRGVAGYEEREKGRELRGGGSPGCGS